MAVAGGTVAVPDWLPLDRLLLEAWQGWQDGLCPQCGRHMSEHAGKTWRDYEPRVDITCPLTEAQERHQSELDAKAGNKDAKPDKRRWTTSLHGLADATNELAQHIKALLTPKPPE